MARSRRVLLLIGLSVVGLGALFVLASVVEHVWYSGAVLPGVSLDGTHVGGRNDAEVRAAIERLRRRAQTTTPIHATPAARRSSSTRA